MAVLELAVPYHRCARVLRWLALSLLAYVGVLAVVRVDWSSALAHTLVPRLFPPPAKTRRFAHCPDWWA
jgi:hypothetical protein